MTPDLPAAQAALAIVAQFLGAPATPITPVVSPVADVSPANLIAYPPLANIVASPALFDPAAKSVDVTFTPDKVPPSTTIVNLFTRDGPLVSRWNYVATTQTLTWQPGEATPKSIHIPIVGGAKDGAYFQIVETPIGGKTVYVNVTAKTGAAATVPAGGVDAVLPPWPTTPATYVMDIPNLKVTGCGASGWTTDCVYNAQKANGETGFYADLDHPMASDAPPIQVRDGKLILHTAPLTAPFVYGGNSYQQQGAILVGYRVPAAQFQYGWSETCAQMPSRKGAWPALWSMPISHTWTAEIDLHEGFPNPAFDPTRMTHHALHGLNGSFGTNSGFVTPGPTDMTSATHCYGMVVDPTHITYYLDRIPNYQMVNPFAQTRFAPLFSVAVVSTGPYTDGSGDMVISSYRSRTDQ